MKIKKQKYPRRAYKLNFKKKPTNTRNYYFNYEKKHARKWSKD